MLEYANYSEVVERAHLAVLEPGEVNQLIVLIHSFRCHGSDYARVRYDSVLLLLAVIKGVGSYILSQELLMTLALA